MAKTKHCLTGAGAPGKLPMPGNPDPGPGVHSPAGRMPASPAAVLLCLLATLCPAAIAAQSLHDRINSALHRLIADPQMKHAVASLTVLDARNGNIMYALNKETGLAPASCQKTITAASSFYLLGQDFRYHTKLSCTGGIRDHVLHGNLVIRGAGDPMLGSWRYPSTKMKVILKRWVEAVRQAGIRQVAGRIIGDASSFDTQMPPDGWIWQDMGNYYGAGASALTWHENQYDLHLLPGSRAGAPVKITGADPPVELHFINELKTGSPGSGDHTYIYAAPYSHFAYLRGTAPANDKDFSVSGSVPDPALLCARGLEDALKQAGIPVLQPAGTARLPDKGAGDHTGTLAKTIDNYASPSLDSIIYWFLHRSINLYGEQLVKTMALYAGGDQPDEAVSTRAGIAVEKKFWKTKGIDPAALNMLDGSGLSPGNRVTTYSMARVLYAVRQEKWYHTYRDCLPVIHHIRMKSGLINGVCSYAGYLDTGKGVPLIFSFIINNYSGSTSALRAKMFRVLDVMKQ